MKKIISARNFIILLPLLVLVAALLYGLPQVDVVRAVGVEVKRVDLADNEAGQQRTRDIYQLQMETLDRQPRVYRNEDNIFYLKFNSANLQTQIQSFANGKQLVALRHYGIRLPLFSTFPNAVNVWPVEEGYRHIPIFNSAVLLSLALIAFLGFNKIRHLSHARNERRREQEFDRAKKAETAEREADQQRDRLAEQEKKSAVDDFLELGGKKND